MLFFQREDQDGQDAGGQVKQSGKHPGKADKPPESGMGIKAPIKGKEITGFDHKKGQAEDQIEDCGDEKANSSGLFHKLPSQRASVNAGVTKSQIKTPQRTFGKAPLSTFELMNLAVDML